MESVGSYFAYIYLLRIPILTWTVLLALPFLALPEDAPLGSLLRGLFDIGSERHLQTALSFFLVTTATFLVAATIGITARLIILDGQERFGAGSIPRRNEAGADGIKLILRLIPLSVAVPIVAGTCYQTLPHYRTVLAALLGTGLAVFLFYLVMTWLHDEIWDRVVLRKNAPPFRMSLINSLVGLLAWVVYKIWNGTQRLVTRFSPAGYIDPRKGELRPRHVFAVIQFVISMVFYFGLFVIKKNAPLVDAAPVIPTLCLLLALMMILCWGLSALTFFFDRFRIPVLALLLLWGWTVSYLPQGDNFYVSIPQVKPVPLSPSQALSVRENKPVILVAASGGGIQSAAWTARVLAGLRREFEKQGEAKAEEFDRSIRLISAVSGGSVGAMFIADAYQANGQLPNVGQQLDDYKPLRAAEASSLDDVAWGLVYPDFLWSLVPFFKGFYFSPFYLVNGPNLVSDRGHALENAWKRTPSLTTATLSNWRPDVAKGNKPAIVFNATIVETGERLLLATTDSEPFRQPTNKTSPGWRDFTRLYPETDIPVATAARLSATFPFVTPAARIRRGDVFADQYHVVDGGYYDNYGVATLIEWLDQAMKDPQSKPSRVLILQIRGSPAGLIDPPKGNYGLFFQAAHAFQTLANVRETAQFARNEVELEFVHRLCARVYEILCTVATFEYYRTDRHSDQIPAPLSWHLTPQNIIDLREEWNRHCPQSVAIPALLPRSCDRVLEFLR